MERFISQRGELPALILNDRLISFEEIYSLSDLIKSKLRKSLYPGDIVLVSACGTTEFVASLFACFELGVIFCGWDGVGSVEKLARLVGASGYIETGDAWSFSLLDRDSPSPLKHFTDGGILVTTSGSTGVSEGCATLFETVIDNSFLAAESIGVTDRELSSWIVSIDLS